MALVVEDGSNVSGANTYVSDAEYQSYSSQRGLTIGVDAAAREAELIRAMDYIESFRAKYKGIKSNLSQKLQWPRSNVVIDSYPINSNEIPEELKRAQMEAAIAENSISLMTTANSQNVQSQSVGSLSISYYSGGAYESKQLDAVDAYLKPLLNIGNGTSARACRA